MRILQTTIEKLLYVLIILLFIGVIIIGVIVIKEGGQLRQIVEGHSQSIQTIEANQQKNSIAIKDYIACLLTLNVNNTQTQLQAAELNCFDNAPGVK